MDTVNVINQIIKKCHEHDVDIHLLFVDFWQAFDIIGMSLFQHTKAIGPQKIIRLTKMTLNRLVAIVKRRKGKREGLFEQRMGSDTEISC